MNLYTNKPSSSESKYRQRSKIGPDISVLLEESRKLEQMRRNLLIRQKQSAKKTYHFKLPTLIFDEDTPVITLEDIKSHKEILNLTQEISKDISPKSVKTTKRRNSAFEFRPDVIETLDSP